MQLIFRYVGIKQPLSVYAGGKIIQAVGTAFNVEVKQGKIELLVTDGKVLVTDQSPELIDPMQLENVRLPADSMAILKGQLVALGSTSEKILMLKPTDIQANLSWQQGSLIFRGEPLDKVLQEVSRYTHYEFEFVDAEIIPLSPT